MRVPSFCVTVRSTLAPGGNSISPTRSLGPPLLRAQKILCRPGATVLVARHEDGGRLGVQAGVADGAGGEELDHTWPLHGRGRCRRWRRGRRRLRGRNNSRNHFWLLSSVRRRQTRAPSDLRLSDGRRRGMDSRRVAGCACLCSTKAPTQSRSTRLLARLENPPLPWAGSQSAREGPRQRAFARVGARQPRGCGQDQARHDETRHAQNRASRRQFLEQGIRARMAGYIRGRSSDLGQGACQLAPSCPLACLGHGRIGNPGTKFGFELDRIVEKNAAVPAAQAQVPPRQLARAGRWPARLHWGSARPGWVQGSVERCSRRAAQPWPRSGQDDGTCRARCRQLPKMDLCQGRASTRSPSRKAGHQAPRCRRPAHVCARVLARATCTRASPPRRRTPSWFPGP